MNASSEPVVSWCRHCGVPGQLTGEHVPPRSTNNEAPVRQIVDPFDVETVLREVADWDEGHVVRTLDERCNHRASRWGYVNEYRRWYEMFVARARALARRTNSDPLRGTKPFEIELPYDAHPARFVRQVLGNFLAVQETEHLFAAHPVLPELIGPDPADDSKRRYEGLDIAPLRLYLSVCNVPWCYPKRPIELVETSLAPESEHLWTPGASRVHEAWLLCLAPFAFVLTAKEASDLGQDISHWTQWTVEQRPRKHERRVALPTADQLQGALLAMIYTTDYIVR